MPAAGLAVLFCPMILYPRDPVLMEQLFKSKSTVDNAKSVVQFLIEQAEML